MIVKSSEMPHRFYNEADDRDGYTYEIPDTRQTDETGQVIKGKGTQIVKEEYLHYMTEMLRTYKEQGGDMTLLEMKGFINPGDPLTINMDAIIQDCTQYDNRMITDDEKADPATQLDYFYEADYGLSGFLARYTSIDAYDKVKDRNKKNKDRVTDGKSEMGDPYVSAIDEMLQDPNLSDDERAKLEALKKDRIEELPKRMQEIQDLEDKGDSITPDEKARLEELKKIGNISHQTIGKEALQHLKDQEGKIDGRLLSSTKTLFAHLATTKFLARSTIVTAAQLVADGAMMQIGCSQGKTTILAYASYIDAQKGMKVMNTSSNPGLVMDNFGEFIEPYEELGYDTEMAAITRDDDGNDMVVTRETLGGMNPGDPSVNVTVQVSLDKDGKSNITIPELIEPKEPKKPERSDFKSDDEYDVAKKQYKDKLEKYEKKLKQYKKTVKKVSKMFPRGFGGLSPEEAVKQQLIAEGKIDPNLKFEDRVTQAMQKPIVMADTMTLMKYERCMDTLEKDEDGHIANSICMCDEADCEFMDARPFEVLREAYTPESQKRRFAERKLADQIIADLLEKGEELSIEDLKKVVQDKRKEGIEVSLEFLKDAYDVRTMFQKEGEDYVIEYDEDHNPQKLVTLNPNKRVLEQDTQGHEQAIYAMRANNGAKQKDGTPEKVPEERQVIDVKYPYQVIGKYQTHSLISGTMEDRGIGRFEKEGGNLAQKFKDMRTMLFGTMGFSTPAVEGVVDYRTVGPLTRVDKGMVMSIQEGEPIQEDVEGKLQGDKGFSLGGKSWKGFLGDPANQKKLEENWIKEVQAEITRRTGDKTNPLQPVVVSVLNEEMGKKLGAKEVFTDAHKPSESMKKKGKMFFQKGEAYYMDDAYGRGYNSIFDGKNGRTCINY